MAADVSSPARLSEPAVAPIPQVRFTYQWTTIGTPSRHRRMILRGRQLAFRRYYCCLRRAVGIDQPKTLARPPLPARQPLWKRSFPTDDHQPYGFGEAEISRR